MAWELGIHQIDVGVGDSSLIVVRNDDPNVAGADRAILVDGGLSAAALYVHGLVATHAPNGVSTIVATHYDQDHVNGLINLLFADNLAALCAEVGDIVGNALGTTVYHSARRFAAEAAYVTYGVLCGAFGAHTYQATQYMAYHLPAAKLPVTVLGAADWGAKQANISALYSNLPILVDQKLRLGVSIGAAVDAAPIVVPGAAPGVAAVAAEIEDSLHAALLHLVPDYAQFHTSCIYADAEIIDNGDLSNMPAAYKKAVAGELFEGTRPGLSMPGLNRSRTAKPPNVGLELLWHGNPPPAANPPYAVVVSGCSPNYAAPTGRVWTGAATKTISGGQAKNNLSIGLVVQFNHFRYLTLGDMGSNGEDLLYPALVNHQLPDGGGGNLPLPPAGRPSITAFKVSHHGADSSTSTAFIRALAPKTALISCGIGYGHPENSTLTRLADFTYAQASIEQVLLTNCRYPRMLVPAAPLHPGGPALAQGAVVQDPATDLVLIAGDNYADSMATGRDRGDIAIHVTAADSVAPAGQRAYETSFWNEYEANAATMDITFTAW